MNAQRLARGKRQAFVVKLRISAHPLLVVSHISDGQWDMDWDNAQFCSEC